MDSEKQTEFVGLHIRLRLATDSLYAQATEVYEVANELEDLTKDTTIRYAGLRVRVEARAAFEQAKDLREALEEMGKQMRGELWRGRSLVENPGPLVTYPPRLASPALWLPAASPAVHRA